MKKTIAMLPTLLTIAACQNEEMDANARQLEIERAEVPSTLTSSGDLCRALMQRQRSCSADFIPALVAARVSAGNPPGMRGHEERIGREALIAEAFAEWQSDSTAPAIESTCDGLARSLSPARDVEFRDTASACLANDGCEAFVACAVPLNLVRWKD
jgi:hypothetical protein